MPGRKSDQIIIRVPPGLLNPHLDQQRLLCGTGRHRISKIWGGAGHSCFSGERLKSLWADPCSVTVVGTQCRWACTFCVLQYCEPVPALVWSAHKHILLHNLLIFYLIYLVACIFYWVQWKIIIILWCLLSLFRGTSPKWVQNFLQLLSEHNSIVFNTGSSIATLNIPMSRKGIFSRLCRIPRIK